jgi:hypothetical protein
MKKKEKTLNTGSREELQFMPVKYEKQFTLKEKVFPFVLFL